MGVTGNVPIEAALVGLRGRDGEMGVMGTTGNDEPGDPGKLPGDWGICGIWAIARPVPSASPKPAISIRVRMADPPRM